MLTEERTYSAEGTLSFPKACSKATNKRGNLDDSSSARYDDAGASEILTRPIRKAFHNESGRLLVTFDKSVDKQVTADWKS
jgi:hypothetical protein